MTCLRKQLPYNKINAKKYIPEIDLLKKEDFSGYQKLIYTPRKYQVMSIYSQVSKK